MGGESLDALLLALQSSLAAAQEALKKRSEETARATGGIDETGAPPAPELSFAIPKAGTDGDEYEMLTLPLSGFHDRCRPQISTLSLEFECELKEKRISCFSRERKMAMRIRKNSGARKKRRRLVQIVFRGALHPFGEVLVDGELLMVIPPLEGSPGCRAEAGAERSLCRTLSELWRRLRRPREFVLSEQQAGRIREIPVPPERDGAGK